MQCPHNDCCQFYSLEAVEIRANGTDLDELRGRYCAGNHAACARYAVAKAKGRAAVPANLYPHQHAEARRILASGPE